MDLMVNSDVTILTNPTTCLKRAPFQKRVREAFGNLRIFSYVTPLKAQKRKRENGNNFKFFVYLTFNALNVTRRAEPPGTPSLPGSGTEKSTGKIGLRKVVEEYQLKP